MSSLGGRDVTLGAPAIDVCLRKGDRAKHLEHGPSVVPAVPEVLQAILSDSGLEDRDQDVAAVSDVADHAPEQVRMEAPGPDRRSCGNRDHVVRYGMTA